MIAIRRLTIFSAAIIFARREGGRNLCAQPALDELKPLTVEIPPAGQPQRRLARSAEKHELADQREGPDTDLHVGGRALQQPSDEGCEGVESRLHHPSENDVKRLGWLRLLANDEHHPLLEFVPTEEEIGEAVNERQQHVKQAGARRRRARERVGYIVGQPSEAPIELFGDMLGAGEIDAFLAVEIIVERRQRRRRRFRRASALTRRRSRACRIRRARRK